MVPRPSNKYLSPLPKCSQQFADRTVGRDWIALWQNDSEAKSSLRIRFENGSQARLRHFPVRVLHIIKSRSIGLPDIDQAASDRPTIRQNQRSDEERNAFDSRSNIEPVGDATGRAFDVEQPEDGLLSYADGSAVVLRDNQLRKSERVRKTNKLLTYICAEITRTREELDSVKPLRLDQLHLPGEVMQVLDQRCHNSCRRESGVFSIRRTVYAVMLCSLKLRIFPSWSSPQ